jgi:hypothetical protein
MPNEIRRAEVAGPITPSLHDSIMARLNGLNDAHAVVLSVDYDNTSNMAKLAVFGNVGDGWSFAGYLAHEVKSHHTEAGFEIRKVF